MEGRDSVFDDLSSLSSTTPGASTTTTNSPALPLPTSTSEYTLNASPLAHFSERNSHGSSTATASSSSTSPHSAAPVIHNNIDSDHDPKVDLFSTLFSPPTPPASPNRPAAPALEPEKEMAGEALRRQRTRSTASTASSFGDFVSPDDGEVDQELRGRKGPPQPLDDPYQPPRASKTRTLSSASSDFGAFVSVSGGDDPLGADFGDFEGGLQQPMTATPTNANSAQGQKGGMRPLSRASSLASRRAESRSRGSTPSNLNTQQANPTLSFFDQFAQEAKQRSDRRSDVLNELLRYEDDPMYFLNTTNASWPSPITPTPSTAKAPPPAAEPPKKSAFVASPPPLMLFSPDAPQTPMETSHSAKTIRAPSPPRSPSISSLAALDPLVPTSAAVTITNQTFSNLNVNPNRIPTPTSDALEDLARDFDFTHDVDHHFFRLPPPPPSSGAGTSVMRPTPYSPPQSRGQVHDSDSYVPSPEGRPTPMRSSSIAVADPLPAAPITSARIVAGSSSPPGQSPEASYNGSPAISFSSSYGDHAHDPEWQEHGDHAPDGRLGERKGMTRAKSATSLSASLSGSISALPGRWMATFLRGGENNATGNAGVNQSASHNGARPALESVFQDHREREPRHAQTMPASSSATPPLPPTFTHASAFGPPRTSSSNIAGLPSSSSTLSHSPSPFAAHTYIPPSGAPGYAGEGYGSSGRVWDKGYSDALEREMRESAGAQQRHTVDGGGEGAARGWGSSFGFGFGTRRVRSTTDGAGGVDARMRQESSALAAHGKATNELNGARGYINTVGNVNGDAQGFGAFIEKKTGKVELVGRSEMTTPVLSADLATLLRPYFPALARLPKKWTLIYSLDQHGISLNTLYTRCATHADRRPAPGEVKSEAMVIALRDAEGAVFGVWLAEGIKEGKSGRGYFGGGESFLWKYHQDALKVFKCTGRNNYVALCEPEYISFGGGDGHYGLYLDETLFDGSSAPCPTFNNEPLCAPGPKRGATVSFECVGLEIWGMGG